MLVWGGVAGEIVIVVVFVVGGGDDGGHCHDHHGGGSSGRGNGSGRSSRAIKVLSRDESSGNNN